MEPVARSGSSTLSALSDLGGDILTMISYPSPRAARGPPLHCIRSRRRGTSGTAQRAAPPLTFVDVQTAWHLQRCAMKPCKGLAP